MESPTLGARRGRRIIYRQAALKGRWSMVGCSLVEWRTEATWSNTLEAQEKSADSRDSLKALLVVVAVAWQVFFSSKSIPLSSGHF